MGNVIFGIKDVSELKRLTYPGILLSHLSMGKFDMHNAGGNLVWDDAPVPH